MKKPFQIAFAISFILISIVSTFVELEQIHNIILASIVPSFLLTIISFFDEIISKCEETAEILINGLQRAKDESIEERNQIPNDITPKDKDLWIRRCSLDRILENIDYDSEVFALTNTICEKLKKISFYLVIISYVLLILSLVFAPLFIDLFSSVNSNSITLWSLTILYINIELKQEFCDLVFDRIRRYANRNKYKIML